MEELFTVIVVRVAIEVVGCGIIIINKVYKEFKTITTIIFFY
jgi:hypothetical protein